MTQRFPAGQWVPRVDRRQVGITELNCVCTARIRRRPDPVIIIEEFLAAGHVVLHLGPASRREHGATRGTSRTVASSRLPASSSLLYVSTRLIRARSRRLTAAARHFVVRAAKWIAAGPVRPRTTTFARIPPRPAAFRPKSFRGTQRTYVVSHVP